MSVRLDPFQNIVGVGWRTDETETEPPSEELPLPEHYCEFTATQHVVELSANYAWTDRGLNQYRTVIPEEELLGEYEESTEGGKLWRIDEQVVLTQMKETIVSRDVFESNRTNRHSTWIMTFGWWEGDDEPPSYRDTLYLMERLKGKYIVHNGVYSPVIPRLRLHFVPGEDAPTYYPYAYFGPSGWPVANVPSYEQGLYDSRAWGSGAITGPGPVHNIADGDTFATKRFALGLEPGTVHRVWLTDTLET